jgi:signal transduction histidine kinase
MQTLAFGAGASAFVSKTSMGTDLLPAMEALARHEAPSLPSISPNHGSSATDNLKLDFLAGGGEMAQLMRKHDWASTPLGPIEQWPQSLRTSVSLILNSQHPMWVGWGPSMTFLYNDAYVSVLSLAKHPWALGRPAPEVWAEIWDVCGPLAESVFSRGEASFMDDVQLFMNRGYFLEETYYSFSYSPIRDEQGKVGGLFCPSNEVTGTILNARRLRTLSELATHSAAEKTVDAACVAAIATIKKDPDDVPFAALFLIEAEPGAARLVKACGLSDEFFGFGSPTIPLEGVDLGPLSHAVVDVIKTSTGQVVDVQDMSGLPLGSANQRVRQAIVLPVTSPGQSQPVAALVAGVSPAQRLNPEYRTFFDLVATQIANAIANAQAYAEARKRVELLAELDRAKTVFFSNVSHEFRTPLTLMLGPLEDMLGDSERWSGNDKEQLTAVHRNSLRLLKLVNSLLDFSRIEAGRVEAVYQPTDIAAFTIELASSFRSAMERAGLRFEVECESITEPVYVDHDMWEKIVLNLLSNAFKFTFEGTVSVRLTSLEGNVLLQVQDTGTGIPEKELPHLFERFHRVAGVTGRTHEGTGIGLALVQELAKLHKGSVSVSSEQGIGTTFTVTIPIGNVHLPKDRVGAVRTLSPSAIAAETYVDEALRWLPQKDAEKNKLDAPSSLLGNLGAGWAATGGGSSSLWLTTIPICVSICDDCLRNDTASTQ